MAKATGTNDTKKISFGTKKRGKAKKSYNKHSRRKKVYRGQGR